MDPHYPHNPSYDAQIEIIDNELEKIVSKLKQLFLYEKSLIIFTSDHGETLGEHNTPVGHGWLLYKEEFNVPLIIKFPKNKYQKKIDHIVRNIDKLPTILDYVGTKSKIKKDGVSLLPMIKKIKILI
jgi:arylsulfatase A-like enzyme